MRELLKILLLEDCPDDAKLIQHLLLKKKMNCKFSLAVDKKTYLLALDQFRPDIILSDHSLPQFNSLEALAVARRQFPGIPFIMVTGTVSEEFAAEIIKSGADDYILKDRLARLPAAINIVLHLRQTEKEKLEAAEKLKRSEEKYRTIFYKSPLPKWIYDPDSLYFLEVNEAATRHYGYSQEEFLSMTLLGIRPKEDARLLLEDIEKIREGSDTRHGTWRHITKNDEIIIVETTAHSIDYNGRTARLVVANDITERIKAEQTIIQSESNLRAIFENTSEGFLLMDRDAIVIAFNSKAGDYTLFSKGKKIQIGQSIYDCVDSSRLAFFREIIQKAKGGESIRYDRSYEMADGNTSWIEFSATPVMEADQVKGICVTGRDVSEKKTTELEREFDRNNLKALLNNTNDPMWSVDSNLRLITYNEAFDKMFKAMSGKLVTSGIDILTSGFNKEQLNRFQNHYKRALSGESFTETEYADFPDDRWSEISFYPIYNRDTVNGVACFSHDITWRKQAEKEITDYKNALDQSSIVSITDQKGGIKYINNNFCKISGYLPEELLGRDHRIINSGYHASTYIKRLWTTVTKGNIWRGQFCNQAKDGSLYWVDATIIPFLNNRGKPVQYLAITNNITENKLMEQEMTEQKIQEQKKIVRAIIKAQEKERNFLGLELHDNINQILASTKLYLEIAGNKHEETKELNKYAMELINSSIEGIRLLCSNLVTPLKNIDLEELVQKLLCKLEQNTMIKTDFSYTVSNELLPDDLKLNIYRILQEHLNNIVKHASAKKVTVSILADNSVINVAVGDDGKGFDVNKKRKGIGISNMINRIETFNGEVAIETSPGKGCRIVIKAPY